ncbi:MAG: class C sortase [Clostridia bacterium]|nr:class C sortase [Clostridia bacterium]
MEEKKKKNKKKRSWVSTLILLLIFLLGIGIVAYPTVADWWNSFHQSRAIASYTAAVEETDETQLNQMIREAEIHNAGLPYMSNRYAVTDEFKEKYNSLLNLAGNGIIGYIRIESIGVNLPIYHGTSETVLQVAIGHIEYSSLPVGGKGSHVLLSGHRGLPSARLFTDLDKLSEGDKFVITVLNRTMTYEVDQIRIVEPNDLANIGFVPGKDYVTLITCTPYSINTHRLLVRGHRVENEAPEVVVLPDATRIPNYLAIVAVGVPLLFLFLFGMVIYYSIKKPKRPTAQIRAMIARDAAQSLKRENDDPQTNDVTSDETAAGESFAEEPSEAIDGGEDSKSIEQQDVSGNGDSP